MGSYLRNTKKVLETIEYPIQNYGVEEPTMWRQRRDAAGIWAWA